ncbi:unnamed protein product [Paramecium pentaurelia]|uniref:Uncharacterized protein n=1 Tax=Paramecium pentaurelia TaxID=43138 RepID=A0A8S1X738_9CILI|nr:unnamed protein product [Paramecium pentaurelia]
MSQHLSNLHMVTNKYYSCLIPKQLEFPDYEHSDPTTQLKQAEADSQVSHGDEHCQQELLFKKYLELQDKQ